MCCWKYRRTFISFYSQQHLHCTYAKSTQVSPHDIPDALVRRAIEPDADLTPTIHSDETDPTAKRALPEMKATRAKGVLSRLLNGAGSGNNSESECTEDSDCDDGDRCTEDFCEIFDGEEFGVCRSEDILCDPPSFCQEDSDCPEDPSPCYEPFCELIEDGFGVCRIEDSNLCGACEEDSDCNDGDVCTSDFCAEPFGICSSDDIPGCVPCQEDSDCPEDPDPCYEPFCELIEDGFGVCRIDDIPDCTTSSPGGIETPKSIIESKCPCPSGWKSHGEYVGCVNKAVKALDITKSEKRSIKKEAANSNCGKKTTKATLQLEATSAKEQPNNSGHTLAAISAWAILPVLTWWFLQM